MSSATADQEPNQRLDKIQHKLGRRSIARQMWGSFALLLLVLSVSGLISSYLLLQVVAIVKQVVEVDDPLERATLEMEINVHEATEGILSYVFEPHPRYIDRFHDSLEDYERYAAQFTTLMTASGKADLADKVTGIQQQHHTLGDEIIEVVQQRNSALATFAAKAEELDNLTDDSLQKGLDPEDPDYVTKLHATLDLEINADEAISAITGYATSSNRKLLHELADAREDFERFLVLYRTTSLSKAEQSLIESISKDFDDLLAIGDQIVFLTDSLTSKLQAFRDTLKEFDSVIDDEVQLVVHARKQTAHAETQSTSLFALTIIIVMALVVLITAAVSTWIITSKIGRSFRTLVTGIGKFANGNFEHRISLRSDDELGKLGTAFNQMVEQRKEAMDALDDKNRMLEELSEKLSKYLSPQVYESIFSGERDVSISTQRKKLTVFFSDLKDFTNTTDDLEPEELTALLNEYLTEMSDIALQYGATIDKYVGDAMLLFFGDPTSMGVKEDAMTCVRMAIAMQRRMAGLRAEWRDAGHERPFHMRVGINTGYCNVGNFGSAARMDYTIIGGEVNLAARLEGICEPDGIMLAYETYSLVRDFVDAEEQEPMNVKGLNRKIRPYAVQGIYDQSDDEQGIIHSESEALRLHVDLRKIEKQRRIDIAEELERQAKAIRKGLTDGN